MSIKSLTTQQEQLETRRQKPDNVLGNHASDYMLHSKEARLRQQNQMRLQKLANPNMKTTLKTNQVHNHLTTSENRISPNRYSHCARKWEFIGSKLKNNCFREIKPIRQIHFRQGWLTPPKWLRP